MMMTPSTSLIDAHHHLWDPRQRTYPWMAGLPQLQRRFGPRDFTAVAQPARVTGSILVQTVSDAEETKEFLRTAAESSTILGVVGWAPLTSPDVADVLAELAAGPGGDRLVGIRHQVHDEPHPEWLDRADVRGGLRAVAEAGLVYDLLVRERELPSAIRAVRELPELAFVLDHAGKPDIAGARMDPWRDQMRDLAGLSNVVVKVSGLVTEAGLDWRRPDLAPYVDHLLDVFGSRRLMFGSDWPVCLLAASYREVLDTAVSLLADLSPEETADVFGRTAKATYAVDVAEPQVALL